MHTQQDEPCGSAKIRSRPQVLQVGQGRIQNKTKGVVTGGYWRSRATTISDQVTSAHISVTSTRFGDSAQSGLSHLGLFSEAMLVGRGHQCGPMLLG